jgi:hypothetical protein
MHDTAHDNEAAFRYRYATAFVRGRFLSVARTIGVEEDNGRMVANSREDSCFAA